MMMGLAVELTLIATVPAVALAVRTRTSWRLGRHSVATMARIVRLDASGPERTSSGRYGAAQVDVEISVPDTPAVTATLYLPLRALRGADVQPGWLLPVRYAPGRASRNPLVVVTGPPVPPPGS